MWRGHIDDTGHVPAPPHRAPVLTWKLMGISAASNFPFPELPAFFSGGMEAEMSSELSEAWQLTYLIRTLATLILKTRLLFFLLSYFLMHHSITRQDIVCLCFSFSGFIWKTSVSLKQLLLLSDLLVTRAECSVKIKFCTGLYRLKEAIVKQDTLKSGEGCSSWNRNPKYFNSATANEFEKRTDKPVCYCGLMAEQLLSNNAHILAKEQNFHNIGDASWCWL